jgi:hypothetical protein
MTPPGLEAESGTAQDRLQSLFSGVRLRRIDSQLA